MVVSGLEQEEASTMVASAVCSARRSIVLDCRKSRSQAASMPTAVIGDLGAGEKDTRETGNHDNRIRVWLFINVGEFRRTSPVRVSIFFPCVGREKLCYRRGCSSHTTLSPSLLPRYKLLTVARAVGVCAQVSRSPSWVGRWMVRRSSPGVWSIA